MSEITPIMISCGCITTKSIITNLEIGAYICKFMDGILYSALSAAGA